MFKKHAIQIKLVRTADSEINEDPKPSAPIDYDNITKVATKRLVIGIVVVLAVATVLTVAKEVAINKMTH